jgi:(2Fe-2S) ferredoxin
MSYYRRHLFFCTHQAEEGKSCCNRHGAKKLHQYAKEQVKALGLHQPGEYRINKSGCMGRCDQGPTVVVYPDNVWYTYVDREDIDEIINEHLLNGREVARLKLSD